MLRIKPTLIITGAILTILAAAAYSYTSLQRANEQLVRQVELLTTELAQREAEADQLARDIESVEAINDELLAERARLAAIESRYQATTEELTQQLTAAQQAVNELRQSHHEDVKSWANTRVPDSALRLLGTARTESDNADSDNDHTYIFDAAGQSSIAVHRAQF